MGRGQGQAGGRRGRGGWEGRSKVGIDIRQERYKDEKVNKI